MITGGTNTGVMKQVGDAMEGRSKNLVGIATWGIVYNRKELEKKQNVINYKVESSMVLENEACLDHNHGYFLLFDDGSSNQFGREIDFRSKLEERIMKTGNSFFVLCFFLSSFSFTYIHDSQDSRGGYLFNSSLPPPPASQTLRQ